MQVLTNMAKAFAFLADLADLAEKKTSFIKPSANEYAVTSEGDPNTGAIVGDDEVRLIDAQATPKMAREVIKPAHKVTGKPIKHVLLSHYHAGHARRASAYKAEQVISSQASLDLVPARGKQDMTGGPGRFPRLFAVPSQSPA